MRAYCSTTTTTRDTAMGNSWKEEPVTGDQTIRVHSATMPKHCGALVSVSGFASAVGGPVRAARCIETGELHVEQAPESGVPFQHRQFITGDEVTTT